MKENRPWMKRNKRNEWPGSHPLTVEQVTGSTALVNIQGSRISDIASLGLPLISTGGGGACTGLGMELGVAGSRTEMWKTRCTACMLSGSVRISKIYYIHDYSRLTILSRLKPMKQLKTISSNILKYSYKLSISLWPYRSTYIYPKSPTCADFIDSQTLWLSISTVHSRNNYSTPLILS